MTVLQSRPAASPADVTGTPRRAPRTVRRVTLDGAASLIGSASASLALVTVLYEHVLPFSGTLGFLVCWYLVFLACYAALVSMSNPRPVVVDRVVTATLWVAASVVLFAIGTTLYYTFHRGWDAFTHTNFYTQTMAGVSPTAPLAQGGILHAIVGTGIEIGLAVVVSVPLGIGTAVYLSEVGGPGTRLVRTVVEAMTALPEILAALFVYVVLIVEFGWPKSGLAVSAAMAVTMVPIIARASEVSLRVVPNGLREASMALGSSRWTTVRKVVLPCAAPALVNSTILGVARAIGETAVPLILSGSSSFMNYNPTTNEMNSLPLSIYTAVKTHEDAQITRAFGAASVLLVAVLVLFAIARWLTRGKAAQR